MPPSRVMLLGPGWISKVITGYEGYDSELCRYVLRVMDGGNLELSLEPRNLFSQRPVLSSAETVVSWLGSEEATTDGKEDACHPSLFSEDLSTMGNSYGECLALT